jgi:S-formylglutathione hydrolase FrmB
MVRSKRAHRLGESLLAVCPVVALLSGAPAFAQAPDACREALVSQGPLAGNHPRVESRTLTVDGVDYPFNVLLPSGYVSGTRYPVLYLLHGATQNQDSWLSFSDIEAFTEPFEGAGAAIVVMPVGDPLGISFDWRNSQRRWETLYARELIPYIDSNFKTLGDRSHRAIAGLSMGGVSAMVAAAHHPDLFVAAGSFSGPLLDFTLFSPAEEAVFYPGDLGLNVVCAGSQPGSPGLFGDPVTDDLWWHNSNPTDLAANFSGVSVYVASGDGTPCDERDLMDIHGPLDLFDLIARPMSERFASALTEAGVPHTTDFYGCGIHTSRYYQKDLHTFWPLMVGAFGAAAPDAFDYRRADPKFSVWGWDFEADPSRATEFLDVADASCNGVGVTGSGMTTITTAPCFAPGEAVALHRAVEPSATADDQGRITFTVDLGPPHTEQQYTPLARILEAAGGYFRSYAVAMRSVP